ncbi:MAG TPA: efflux RND transporter periplasmic adaptor subunit [Gammaproteobacteria bacterium]|nr:efflux RND transporter periplasmic adaptor subunit [Gammaproteobacteria bacterium]
MKLIPKTPLVILLLLLQACSGDKAADDKGKSSPKQVSTSVAALRDTQIIETLPGTIEARRSARIHNQQAGVIDQILAFQGDKVKQGALLARLDDKLLSAQRDKAMATLEQGKLDLKRAEALADNKLISDDALAQARTRVAIAQADARLAQAQFDYSRITAPFNGVISERLVDEGDVVANQTPLFTLLDTQNLKAIVSVPENLLVQLAVNNTASITIDSARLKDIPGRITRVSPALNEQTRQGEIEIEISPVPAGMLPGQICQVNLQGRQTATLMVDFDAIRHDTGGAFVYVLQADKVQRVGVQTGVQHEGHIEIVHGIQAGDVVVIKGFTGLHDGKAVTLANQ